LWFVVNRVEVIRNNSPVEQWYYVQSKENPADIASRGIKASNLMIANGSLVPDSTIRVKLTN